MAEVVDGVVGYLGSTDEHARLFGEAFAATVFNDCGFALSSSESARGGEAVVAEAFHEYERARRVSLTSETPRSWLKPRNPLQIVVMSAVLEPDAPVAEPVSATVAEVAPNVPPKSQKVVEIAETAMAGRRVVTYQSRRGHARIELSRNADRVLKGIGMTAAASLFAVAGYFHGFDLAIDDIDEGAQITSGYSMTAVIKAGEIVASILHIADPNANNDNVAGEQPGR